MNMQEYHNIRRKKFAELNKKRVDDAYEYYCSLSEEDKQIAEYTFVRKIAQHFCLSIGIARNITINLIAEYKIQFHKYKHSSPSFGFTGHRHSAETRAAISEASTKINKARVIKCKEQGINYRNYRQDADKQIEVANFNNTRSKSISSDKIIV